MIILNVKSALFYYVATRVQGNQGFIFNLCTIFTARYENDVTEWLPRWPENLKQAVKYEGYLPSKKRLLKD